MIRRLIPIGILTLSACTPAQITAWVAWHREDPAAAIEFATRPEIRALFEAREPDEELTDRHGSRWDDIAWCESGGRWNYPPVTNSTGTYSGGLMIGHRWWPLFGGREFAQFPYLATRGQQIEIAERILDANGWDAWDCA